MLKSVATNSLREYTGSEIFDSGISPIKRQIAFMTTLSLYKSSTIFWTRPVLNQLFKPVLRPRYAPPKTVWFSYRICPVERFYRNAHARHTSELPQSITSHSDSAVWPAADALGWQRIDDSQKFKKQLKLKLPSETEYRAKLGVRKSGHT